MAFPRGQYGDPALYVERMESLEIGCAGCAFHQRNRTDARYGCRMEVDGYPDKTNKDCRMWRRNERRWPLLG